MAGLSTTHYDSATIAIASATAGDTATATSGGTLGGRALSDVAHSSGGLRYFEVEVVQLRSSTNTWGIGIVDNTSNLTQWIGGDTHSGFWWRDSSAISLYASGARLSFHGNSAGGVGMRALVWVDPASRKMWITATDRVGGRYGDGTARPDLGTGETWTIPGTGPLRVALSPSRGDGATNANVLRFCSRYSQLRVCGAEQLGALPWDARTITLSGPLNPDHVAVGEGLYWAWFDHPNPLAISTAPTSTGTVTVGSGPSYEINVITSLDASQVGSLLIMKDDGTPVACRAHYAPVSVP